MTQLLPANYRWARADAFPNAVRAAQGVAFEAETSGLSHEEIVVLPTAAPETPERTSMRTGEVARPSMSVVEWYSRSLQWIGRFWAAGIFAFAAYDMLSLVAIRRMRAASGPVDGEIVALTERIKQRLGVTADVQVRCLAGVTTALFKTLRADADWTTSRPTLRTNRARCIGPRRDSGALLHFA